MIPTWDALVYTIFAIIPGFLIDTILRMKLPVQRRSASFSLFRFIVLSVINYSIWAWKIPELFYQQDKMCAKFLYQIIGIVFISPVLIGVVLTFLANIEWVENILHRVGFNLSNMAPSAWDFRFHHLVKSGSRYVIVTLIDGSIVYGGYGRRSHASGEGPDQDLYLEESYTYNKGWIKVNRNDGILICKNQIRSIEFLE